MTGQTGQSISDATATNKICITPLKYKDSEPLAGWSIVSLKNNIKYYAIYAHENVYMH